jgi:hypothetical protein
MKDGRKEATAYQEAMEAYPENVEANLKEMKSVAEQEKAPKVQTVRTLNKRHRGRHLAMQRRGKPKERTQGNVQCRKKLAAAPRRMTAVQEWHVARDTGVRDKTRTMLQKEPRKDERRRRELEIFGMRQRDKEETARSLYI